MGLAKVFQHEFPIEPFDFTGLINQPGITPVFYSKEANSKEELLAIGAIESLCTKGERRFEEVALWSEELFARIENQKVGQSGGKAAIVGGFSFSPDASLDIFWESFGNTRFFLPKWIFRKKGDTTHATLFLRSTTPEEADQQVAVEKALLEGYLAASAKVNAQPTLRVKASLPVTKTQWCLSVDRAIEEIINGNVQKVVLSRAMDLEFNQIVNPVPILRELSLSNPNSSLFYISFEPQHAFIASTPETLVNVEKDVFQTAALAGSTARNLDPEIDAHLANELLSSEKDLGEHAFVVETIRQQLLGIGIKLTMTDTPAIRKLPNIQHLETAIEGHLGKGQHIFSLADLLHPTPALGGSPRDIALGIIGQLETFSRGWYAGPVGWVNARGDGQFHVAIRSAVQAGRKLRLYAGAGIVENSNAESEWEETMLKLGTILAALKRSGMINETFEP